MNETRKHLISFLKKVVDESYKREELENFTMMVYQTPEFEKVRIEVCNMLLSPANNNPTEQSERIVALREMIDLLEHGQI